MRREDNKGAAGVSLRGEYVERVLVVSCFVSKNRHRACFGFQSFFRVVQLQLRGGAGGGVHKRVVDHKFASTN